MKSFQLFLATAVLSLYAADVSAAPRNAETDAFAQEPSQPDGNQNLDGSYPSLSDFVRDINGAPCGLNCERDANERRARESQPTYYGLSGN
ncbi:MAG: hypothetical protein WDN02_03570 [Methylovirgula sp.]|uniref:hypothetical protein n=1 Tax=Methylovirgula sp. TaxID=1978224 RepID=UPI0030767174